MSLGAYFWYEIHTSVFAVQARMIEAVLVGSGSSFPSIGAGRCLIVGRPNQRRTTNIVDNDKKGAYC